MLTNSRPLSHSISGAKLGYEHEPKPHETVEKVGRAEEILGPVSV
jgi:hypothetical protein